MPSPTPTPVPLLDAAPRTTSRTLLPVGAGHPAARRYSLARRNLLPRDELVMAVQGRWAHHHLVEHGASLESFFWCPAGQDDSPDVLVRAAAAQAQASYRISERTLSRLHPGLRGPKVLSVVRLPRWSVPELLGSAASLLLVADGIEYAGNLGTLVRSVDACGAAGLLLTCPVARLSHPKVFTASRGTVLTTPVVDISVGAAHQALTAAGFTVVVADPAAKHTYRDVAPGVTRVAIVVGSEGDGVSDAWRREDVAKVAIPMRGHADSLNVAVSASILLFEARQRLDHRS